MNFEQALSHMKRGGTVRLGDDSYKFTKLGGGPMIGIIKNKEGTEYELTLISITLTPNQLLSNEWETAD
jgi:hypothetical protein